MKMLLLLGEDCSLCDDAKKKFEKDFWREIDNGEAKIVNLDEDEKAQEMFLENDLPLAPVLVLVTDNDRVVSHIEPKDFFEGLKEAPPVPEGADKATVESNGK